MRGRQLGVILALLLLPVTVVFVRSASAALVAPEFFDGPQNRTCASMARLGQQWSQLKVDPNRDGTFSDGTLTVRIFNREPDRTAGRSLPWDCA